MLLAFFATASRSTALSYCPLSMKKSAHRCSNSGSVLSSRSSEIIWSTLNCLVVNAKSRAFEKLPACRSETRVYQTYSYINCRQRWHLFFVFFFHGFSSTLICFIHSKIPQIFSLVTGTWSYRYQKLHCKYLSASSIKGDRDTSGK